MPHSQPIKREKQKKTTRVINQKEPDLKDLPKIPAGVNKPVRAVHYVEFGDAPAKKVQFFVQELNKVYQGTPGGQHFVVPVRHGRVTTEVDFEGEFLKVVNELCEVDDNGQIVMKNGSDEVLVLRFRG